VVLCHGGDLFFGVEDEFFCKALRWVGNSLFVPGRFFLESSHVLSFFKNYAATNLQNLGKKQPSIAMHQGGELFLVSIEDFFGKMRAIHHLCF